MEKHQIVKQRRLPNTPFLKLSYKAALITSGIAVVIAYAYNRWRSDEVVYIIKSGYYDDEELRKHTVRMSLIPVFTFKPRNAMVDRIEEEDAIGAISSRPPSIAEATLDH